MKNHQSSIINNKYSIKIGWLYPELMSTYGDRGNIIVLKKRCDWRGIKAEILNLNKGFNVKALENIDVLFMGGAEDVQQQIVSNDFTKEKIADLKKEIEDGVPGLYICGALQFLGKYYREANGTKIKGLGIFDLYTESPGTDKSRLIGNIAIKPIHNSEFIIHNSNYIVGFENHGGRTYLGKSLKPFGKVVKGFGNNGEDRTEGAVYKNSIGTYLHGPILPKNPQIADFLIDKALELKYRKEIKIKKIDDSLEKTAHDFILQKMAQS